MSSILAFAAAVAIAAFVGKRYRPGDEYRGSGIQGGGLPAWLFGPARSVLYVLVAFCGWLVWWANADTWNPSLTWWAAQLILNGIWSWLLFGRHALSAALAASALMLLAVLGFVVTAAEYSPAAAWLFIPHAAWSAVVAYLTYRLWKFTAPATRAR